MSKIIDIALLKRIAQTEHANFKSLSAEKFQNCLSKFIQILNGSDIEALSESGCSNIIGRTLIE